MKKFLFTVASIVLVGLAAHANNEMVAFSENEITLDGGQSTELVLSVVNQPYTTVSGVQYNFIMYDENGQQLDHGCHLEFLPEYGTSEAWAWFGLIMVGSNSQVYHNGTTVNSTNGTYHQTDTWDDEGDYMPINVYGVENVHVTYTGKYNVIMSNVSSNKVFTTDMSYPLQVLKFTVKVDEGWEGNYAELRLVKAEHIYNDGNSERIENQDGIIVLRINNGSAAPTVQTGAPTFRGFAENGVQAFNVEIMPTEPSDIYYRVMSGYYDGEYTECSEWMEYQDILTFTQVGRYRIEAQAIAQGKLPSDVISYEFIVTAIDTPAPEITWTADNGVLTVTATGQGTVRLYIDGVAVPNPYIENYDIYEGINYTATATAKVDGWGISPTTTVAIVVEPIAAPVAPAKPVVTFNEEGDVLNVAVSAEADATLFVNGKQVSNPYGYEVQRTYSYQTIDVVTYAVRDNLTSEVVDTTYVMAPLDKKPVAAPIISTTMDEDYVYVNIEWPAETDGQQIYTGNYQYERGQNDYSVPVEAYVEEGTEWLESAHATYTVEVPSNWSSLTTDAPIVTTNQDDENFTITATGDGVVTIYVTIYDNNTGAGTTYTATGEGEVQYVIARGDEDVQISYYATAVEDATGYDEYTPGISETEYATVEKKDEVTPADPHMTGWWIVLTDINGEESWYELHEGTDGSWVTTVTLNYGEYGTFYWDPELSAAENNVNRPNVPYYFVIDGQVWGAPVDNQATLMGEAANTMSNPLFENDNHYTVPVGYSYVLGVYVDPSQEDQLQDGTWYYVYCAQGPQTDVSELNTAKTVASVRYYNMMGQEMQQADGMTIVVTTYTVGSATAVKVMK